MDRKKILIVAGVCAALLAAAFLAAGCGTKAGPGETPVSTDRGERTVPGALHGTVTDEKGNGVEGALVTAASLDEPPRPVPEMAVITDDKGNYEWPLVPGRYRLSVTAPQGSGSGEVDVRVGEAGDLDIVLRP